MSVVRLGDATSGVVWRLLTPDGEEIWITRNAVWNGVDWIAEDPSQPSRALRFLPDGTIEYVAAGPNQRPLIWSRATIAVDADTLDGIDSTQFVRRDSATTIAVQHTFNPATTGAPFILGANASGQLVTGLNADMVDGIHASGFMTKIADIVVSADTTTVSITGLNIPYPAAFMMVFAAKNPTASNAEWHIRLNGEADSTDWNRQRLSANGTSVAAARVSDNSFVAGAPANSTRSSVAFLVVDPAGLARAHVQAVWTDGTDAVTLRVSACRKNTALAGNITQIDFVATVTNGIGAGSRIVIRQIW